jgi:WD40-like Beta Propeller Repeat
VAFLRTTARFWLRLLLPLLPLLVGAALPRGAWAQGPDASWRTLTTPHFRLHYPEPYAAWAQRAAVWLEAVRERDIAEIGFAPADVVDVVISNPLAEANGEAVPLRGWPRMVLWTSPPPADSETGHYRDWIEDLVVHEEAHLVHLLRPSRNPLLAKLLPVSSIALAPRWVVEGYATLIEGRLTGAGRPNGDMRAAILRRWAQAGLLPPYSRLAADAHSWRGMSMAYLLGSAYLEWLEQRGGPGSLRKLWARMTARTVRSFDEAFAGVWGEAPDSLYNRFRAELTWRAMEAERRVQAVGPLAVREGPLWQALTWTTGAPAVSPDGSQVALVRQYRDRPGELVVWSTAPNAAAEQRWQAEQDRQVAHDPQDVAAVRIRPLPRQPLYTWAPAAGGEPDQPRFLPDGRSLLVTRFLPDREGFLHPDLFQWWPQAGSERRITRQADLHDADPAPDGTWAVAVRDRYGLSQLVAVDLASGAVHPLTEPSVELVYDLPRLAPDARRVAFGLHTGAGWQLGLLALNPDHTPAGRTDLPPPAGASVSAPAWSPDGTTLYAVVGKNGFLDLYAFAAPPLAGTASPPGGAAGGAAAPTVPPSAHTANPLAAVSPNGGAQPVSGTSAPLAPRALTRTQGAALAPAPTPDGKALFYLSLEPDGLSLHRLDLVPAKPSLPEVDAPANLAPAVRPPPPASVPPMVAPAAPAGTATPPGAPGTGSGPPVLAPAAAAPDSAGPVVPSTPAAATAPTSSPAASPRLPVLAAPAASSASSKSITPGTSDGTAPPAPFSGGALDLPILARDAAGPDSPVPAAPAAPADAASPSLDAPSGLAVAGPPAAAPHSSEPPAPAAHADAATPSLDAPSGLPVAGPPAAAPDSPEPPAPAAPAETTPSSSAASGSPGLTQTVAAPDSSSASVATAMPAASKPYGAGRQELLPLLAGGVGNTGEALVMGVRSGDLIGRLDMLALGAVGSPGAVRGGTLAGAWRGWPVAAGLQIFDAVDAPSRQAGPVAPPGSLDLERRGIAATAEWERAGTGDHLQLRGSLLWQRLLPSDLGIADVASGPHPAKPPAAIASAALPPDASDEAAVATAADYHLSRRFGLWRLSANLVGRFDGGHTGGDAGTQWAGDRAGSDSWTRYGSVAGLAVAHEHDRLSVAWRRDGSRQVAHAFDLYQLGGPDSGLLPAAAQDARIVSPALPAGTLVGAEHEEERAELSLGFLPAPLFFERHRLWDGLLLRPQTITLAGVEYRADLAPFPLGRLPALELRLGVARVFSDPLEDGLRWWLLTVIRL